MHTTPIFAMRIATRYGCTVTEIKMDNDTDNGREKAVPLHVSEGDDDGTTETWDTVEEAPIVTKMLAAYTVITLEKAIGRGLFEYY